MASSAGRFFLQAQADGLANFRGWSGSDFGKFRRELDFRNRFWPDCGGREKGKREHFTLFLQTFRTGALAGFPGNVGFANTVRLALAALPYW